MANDVPRQVIVAAFDAMDTAAKAYDGLKQLANEGTIKIAR